MGVLDGAERGGAGAEQAPPQAPQHRRTGGFSVSGEQTLRAAYSTGRTRDARRARAPAVSVPALCTGRGIRGRPGTTAGQPSTRRSSPPDRRRLREGGRPGFASVGPSPRRRRPMGGGAKRGNARGGGGGGGTAVRLRGRASTVEDLWAADLMAGGGGGRVQRERDIGIFEFPARV